MPKRRNESKCIARKRFAAALAIIFSALGGGVAECFGSYFKGNFVSAPGKFSMSHGSSLVALPDDHMVACWYAGAKENGADVQIYCSRKTPTDSSWAAPQRVVQAGETAANGWLQNGTLGNTAMHFDSAGLLWLFYNATTVTRGWSATHVAYKTSTDRGASWSAQGRRITRFWGNSAKNKPLALPDRRLLLPLYHEFVGKYGYTCVMRQERDQLLEQQCARIPGRDHLQPALVELPNGRIGAYLRNAKRDKVLFTELNKSLDQWSNPVSINLANPSAAVDVARASKNGILMVYNPSSVDRSILSVAASRDGLHFTRIRDLEYAPGNGRFAYPTIIPDSRGRLHVVYTYNRTAIKHVVFDRTWLGLP